MSDIYYGQSIPAACADGRVRRAVPRRYAYDGSLATDTWFSVPAFVRVKGKTVRGFLSTGTESDLPVFYAYRYCKNAPLLVTR